MDFRTTLLTGVALALSSNVLYAANWQMATPYPENNFHTQNIHEFVKDVEKATDGDLKINVHSAGSLIKHQEIKNAVRSKQVEIGEFIISNLANEHPIFALDSVPFVASSYEDSKKLYEVSKEALEAQLERQNVKVLYTVPWPPQGLYADREINKIDDMKGIKFRAYSPQTERLAQLTGAVPTQVEVPDLPQAFTTGRVNSMVTSASTGANSKAWDYLSHFYDVAAFLPKNIIVVNKKVFEALDDKTQDALLEAAKKAEERGWDKSQEDHDKQLQILKDNGIKVSDGSDDLNQGLQDIGEKMADEWGKEAGSEGQEIIEAYRKKQEE